MRIKICYLIDTIATDTAGTQRQLLESLKRLNREVFEPTLICLWKSEWMENNEIPCDTYVLGYGGFLKISFFEVLRRFVLFLRQKEFHILQTFFEDSIFVAYLGTLFLKRSPRLLSSRRDIGLGVGQPWYHALYRKALPLVNRRFCGIIANSNKVKEHVVRNEGIPPDKVRVINNGISIAGRSTISPDVFKRVRSDVWVGIAANLIPVKRVDIFLMAFALLRSMVPNVSIHGVVLGDGPLRGPLEAQVEELGLSQYLHFEGAVRDTLPYLQHLDIGVLCSDREGLSNSVLEYMSCALPVVVTDVGGNPELVDTSNGVCVPPGDHEALAAAMASLIGDPSVRKALGEHSREKIVKGYSWERCMDELQAYYRELVL